MKTIYHTSPEKIDKIHTDGLFGSGLFFSSKIYYMTTKENPFVYKMEIDENELLEAREFLYLDCDDYNKIKHIVNEIMTEQGLIEEMALDILAERTDIHTIYYNLENFINYCEENREYSDYFENKKNHYNFITKKDLATIQWKNQERCLRAANALGKKGVILTDEQGTSYLVNMLNSEDKLKLVNE